MKKNVFGLLLLLSNLSMAQESQEVKKETKLFDNDEFIKSDSSLENLSKLRPAFDKDGTVTAGNASGINDGAAGLIITDRKTANKLGLEIMAKIATII